MPIARFQNEGSSACHMVVHADRTTALVPQELGLRIPFDFNQEPEGPGLLKWTLSYLYAELWSMREQGPRLIAPSLPEFTTDRSRPTSMRFPLSIQAVSLLEELRRGGDLPLILRIEATLVGTIERDQIPDPGRRRTLEALGLERDVFGPIRHSDDVTIRIPKFAWEEEILPQWALMDFERIPSPTSLLEHPSLVNTRLDIQALARSLQGASIGSDLEDIMEQCRAPIVGL